MTTTPTRHRAIFHTLKVAEVRRLTDSSIEVTFAIPENLQSNFHYLPGQYVTLRREFDGKEVRRSYSLCRLPTADRISVAIKRDEGGLFSTWANDFLRTGDDIDVMTPQGTFTSRLDNLDGRQVVGVAAGSGITPIITIANHVLSQSDTSRFDLLFSNRSSLDVMFLQELSDLKDRYPSRFALHHILSRERRVGPAMSGRLDEEKLNTIITSIVPALIVDEWVLCGPFDLIQLCRDVLDSHGVDPTHVRFELFTTGEPGEQPARPRNVEVRAGEPTVAIDFTLDGTSATVESPRSANETVLNAALRVRPDVPFACAGGVCGTCRARLIEGSVQMRENYALEPDELEAGYVLTCQSHATSEHIVVNYDV